MLIAPTRKAHDVALATADIIRPPRRLKPSEAAARVLRTEKGPWVPDLVPYMAEPLDQLAGRDYRGIVFVGPARTGKTMGLILGGIAYVVTCAPGDMAVIQMSQDTARDFSRLDLDRAIRNSPELADRMSPRARDDNTFDKFWRSGIVLKVGWPAVSQLSSKTLQYGFVTDYDRPKNVDNVDGEGTLWGLLTKRLETYMSRGKGLAESSPGRLYDDASWKPSTPHEGPPCKGIVELYNSGTRARWYWPCQHCGEFFQAEPGLGNFPMIPGFDELCEVVQQKDLMSVADEWSKVGCPHCGGLHEPTQRTDMQSGGLWLHEGEKLVDGKVEGDRRRSSIVSYWLGGVAAAYQTWPSIVYSYLSAVAAYVRTGDEGPLTKTVNTDQGAPYMPRAASKRRTPEDFVNRLESWPRGKVPQEVRFLTAAVDVQGHRFVVHVMGWGVELESWLIDRFSITASRRPERDLFAALDPAAYVEDWNVLVDQVLERQYEVDGIDLKLRPRLILCDSGGKAGVTANAYEFWRLMRKQGLGKLFMLVKGTGNINAPRVQQVWPDARARKDRQAGRGDVPVWMLNVNQIKDGIAGDLSRDVPGPGYCHLPEWVDEDYFKEITAEDRTIKGWIRQGSAANEAFDLHAYNRAACIILKAEAINWKRPPMWATDFESRIEKEKRAEEAPVQQRPPSPRRNWVKSW